MQNAECASLKYWTDQRLLHFQDFSKKTKYYRTPCTALRTSAQPISFRGNKKKKGGWGCGEEQTSGDVQGLQGGVLRLIGLHETHLE